MAAYKDIVTFKYISKFVIGFHSRRVIQRHNYSFYRQEKDKEEEGGWEEEVNAKALWNVKKKGS